MTKNKKIAIMLLSTVLAVGVIAAFLTFISRDSARVAAPDDIIDADGNRYQAVNLDQMYLALDVAPDGAEAGEYTDEDGNRYSIIEGPDGNLYKAKIIFEEEQGEK